MNEPQEIDPLLSFGVIDTPLGKRVVMSVKMPNTTYAVVMRPELAMQAGDMLADRGRLAQTGLIVASPAVTPNGSAAL